MARKTTEEANVLDRLKLLDEERAGLLEEAKAAALDQANEAIETLNRLGFDYRLVLGAPAPTRRSSSPSTPSVDGSRKGTRTVDPTRPCPVCDFVTNPPHDARKHRSQGDNKTPFTVKELTELGMERV